MITDHETGRSPLTVKGRQARPAKNPTAAMAQWVGF
eukprot:COSAG01_NODE_70832_length_257_cov_1.310127_1_plen_35_part_10